MIGTRTTAYFWRIVEDDFIRPRNITFKRHVFLITKQLRGGGVELKKLSASFENKDETLVREVFIINFLDPEIQKELLKQTVEPRQALEIRINLEIRMQNQHEIQQHNKNLKVANVNAIHYPPNTHSLNWSQKSFISKENVLPSIVQIVEQIAGTNATQKAKPAVIVVC